MKNLTKPENPRKVIIFDTTMGDGELTPGVKMNVQQKIRLAKLLETIGLDVIEVGYPGQDNKDFDEIVTIAKQIKKSIICGLASFKREEISICRVRYATLTHHCQADLRSAVRHIYGNRQTLRDFPAEFEQISPQVVLDAIAYTEQDARTFAIALAIIDDRATGQVYNIAEAEFPTETERIRRIGQVAGWKGEVVIASPSLMPDSWSLPYNLEQYWVVDSTRIRQELGYVEPVLLAEALSAYH
ncbi:hypothetical protein [Coleofasciculus sp.]|uniref:hypothetical protein n=1 Tax=Coleofasciculus sp. TaxID=3100458 RepID=UPI003A39DCE2